MQQVGQLLLFPSYLQKRFSFLLILETPDVPETPDEPHVWSISNNLNLQVSGSITIAYRKLLLNIHNKYQSFFFEEGALFQGKEGPPVLE